MKSHIQIPKVILKQFVIQYGKNKDKFYAIIVAKQSSFTFHTLR